MVPLDVSLVGFPSQMFWEFVSPVQVPGVGVPDVRQKPLMEEFYHEPPPNGCYTGGGIFGKISASPTHLSVTLLSFVVEGLLS